MKGRIFVIGASHGGIEALSKLFGQIPADFPAPIFVTQHIGADSLGGLPRILGRAGKLPVAHPANMEIIQSGKVYVAPPDSHMLVQRGYVWLSRGPRENHTRPAIDPLFRSAASAYGPAVVGVVLTGHLDDGRSGLMAIKDRGGIAVVQDPVEALAPSMPRSAQAHVCIDHCCKLTEMGKPLVNFADDDPSDHVSDANALIDVETRIAGGDFDLKDWFDFEKQSFPSGLGCPDCGGALFEVRDNRILRFRCRAGHAFTARCLLQELARSTDSRFASIFGALIEEASLAKRLSNRGLDRSVDSLTDLAERISQIEHQAVQIGHWLRSCSDWQNTANTFLIH
ncbi:CheB methylesterase [Paraburkholderia caribensis]|uniref:chemotaxis protein CheB n=1 Tax=Paraburkholderia caribensis TaxID=75105 RepID=UPI001CB4DCD4|nr:chemotaxis protein CheB [Paraburkholderia caribensis]CAG9219421.1 CheB methylesterase [Paraburkholderia caribensis]